MRRFTLTILLLIFLLACRDAPAPDAPDTPDAPPTALATDQAMITLAVESGSQSRYQPLIDAFEQEYPGIQVRLVSVSEVSNPDDEGVRALASSFDVFPYSPNRQTETQYLMDLRPFLTLDPDFDTADFYPSLLPAAPEPLYAMPTGAAYYLIYFDKTAFDAAGRPYPALEWTTDEFLETAVALTERDGDNVTRWGYVPAQMRYVPLLAAQLNAPLHTAGGLRLQDPDVAAALGWVSDLFTEYEVAPWLDEYRPADRRSGGDPSPTALIATGQAALWHTTHLLYDANEANVGVTAVPQGDYGLAAEPLIFGFAVSRGTANPEAAWALLDFLSRQPPQDSAFQVSLAPARRSVAAATNFWAQLPPELAPALQYSAENSAAPRIPAQAVEPLMTAFAAQIDDGVSTAVALGQLPPPEPTPADAEVEPVVVVPNVPAENDEEATRITFASSFAFIDVHRRLAAQFTEENPSIRVTLIEGDVYASTPLQQISGADCFLGSTQFLEDDETRTALLPLDPLLALDDALQIEAFYPIMVEPFLRDGQLWGLPAGASAPYMEYNRQIFAEAGIPEPALDWTLADFLEIAQQLTIGEGESKRYGYIEHWPFMQLGFTQAFDVQVIDHSVDPPRFDFTAATDMVIWYVNLVRLYEVQPLIHDSGSFAAESEMFEAMLREGRVAMWPGGGAASTVFRNSVPLDFDVGKASLPLGLSGYRNIYPFAYHILADSPHQEACWQWIKFLSTQPEAVRPVSSSSRLSSARLLPAHIETAESEAFISQVGPTMAAILHHTMSAVPPTESRITSDWQIGSLEWMSPGYYWLRDAYEQAVIEGVSVADALADADVKFSQYRQCVIEQNAFDDYNLRRACILEVSPEFGWLFPERSD